MTVLINASNTSGLTFTSDTSGNIALQSNGANIITTSGANLTVVGTLTTNGNVIQGASTAPSFSYYGSGTQTFSGYAKILVANKEWDTANCVSSSTFTPTVAGYYQLNGQVSATNSTRTMARIYKNGTVYKVGNDVSGYQATVSCIVYANGTTDYFELWGYLGVSNTLNGSIAETWFQGALIRSA